MAPRKASPRQASPLPTVSYASELELPADIRLTVGDFRLILHALYILQETEIDPLNRRQRIRLGLIAIHIHDAISKASRHAGIRRVPFNTE